MTAAAQAAGHISFQPPGEAVERLAEAAATGALHSEAGTVWFVDGMVTHAESGPATGPASLLTASGRISPGAWQETVRRFGPECRVGRMLVEQGLLTQGELELCHLGVLFDAAFFMLSARSAATFFEPGVQHWFGPVSPVSARRLRHETVRRRDLLERIWPWPQVDNAPVVPTARAPRGRAGGRRRRELLHHVDGRRTPADLAHVLGRSAFATMADVRRLAAAGLVATPPDDRAPPDGVRGEGVPGAGPARTTVGLHRRTPGATLPAGHPAAGPGRSTGVPAPRRPRLAADHPLSVLDPDVALLTRVLTALEARL